MDTIRMVTAMVILTVSRISSSHVGNGTIIMPIMAAMQETRMRSLNAVRTLSRFPDRTSSRMRWISDWILYSTISAGPRMSGARAEFPWTLAADASGYGTSSGTHAFHLACRRTHALQDGAGPVGAGIVLGRVQLQGLLERGRRL